MRAVRLWVVRHAALMERAYGAMAGALRGLRPLARAIGPQRLEKPVADAREEGRRICVELIRGIRAIPGIAGVHVMAHRQERMVASIVAESGVFAGRTPLFSPQQSRLRPWPQPVVA